MNNTLEIRTTIPPVDQRSIEWGKRCLIVHGDLDFHGWCSQMACVVAMTDYSMWWLADLYIWGHEKLDKDAVNQVIDDFAGGRKRGTIWNAAYVGRAFPPSSRVWNLEFTYYQAVASLQPKTRMQLMDWTVERGWKRGQLREAITRITSRLQAPATIQSALAAPVVSPGLCESPSVGALPALVPAPLSESGAAPVPDEEAAPGDPRAKLNAGVKFSDDAPIVPSDVDAESGLAVLEESVAAEHCLSCCCLISPAEAQRNAQEREEFNIYLRNRAAFRAWRHENWTPGGMNLPSPNGSYRIGSA